jgi:hypothetical protein
VGGRYTGFFVVVFVALGFSAVGGHAQTTTTGVTLPSEANCGQKQLSFLWWPSGHGASQQYNFPAFPAPHVEVYEGGTTTYSESAFLAYFDDHGDPHFESDRLERDQREPEARRERCADLQLEGLQGEGAAHPGVAGVSDGARCAASRGTSMVSR